MNNYELEIARLNEENNQLRSNIGQRIKTESQLQEKMEEYKTELSEVLVENEELAKGNEGLGKEIQEKNELLDVFEFVPSQDDSKADYIEHVRQEVTLEHKAFLRRIFPNLVSAREEREFFEDQSRHTEWLQKLETKVK